MGNTSDDSPTNKVPSDPRAGINGARDQTSNVQNMLIVVLAFTSGFIDALSFLALNVFASVMTANTVLLGLAVGSGNILNALGSLVALVGYVGGVALGARIVDRTAVPLKIWPRAVRKAFVVEMGVLLLFSLGGLLSDTKPSGLILYTFIALAAIAMGIQSAAVNVLGLSGISTTYITGTWTNFVSSLALRRRPTTSEKRGKEKVETRLQAAVLVVYVLAAITGGVAEANLSLKATIIPVIGIGFVIAATRIRMP